MNPNQANTEREPFTIIVNGRQKEWSEKKISFKDVVILAYGTYEQNDTTVYTVSYKPAESSEHAPTMVEGQEVNVHPGMIFNVSKTDKS